MAKIAISLPDDVLRDIEMERKASGETRSEFFRRAIAALLRHKREREAEDQYVRGYQRHPETEEDLGGLHDLGLAALAQEPWEPGAERQ